MRMTRKAALGATLAALIVGACTSGGGSPSPAASAGPSIASELVLGGPPECPERPACLIGLEETYGLEFRGFTPLDVGGPLTVEALKSGDIQVGLLFTSDPAIAAEGFVLLEDDKKLQLAENLVPMVRKEVNDADPLLAETLNGIMGKLTQEELTNLNKSVVVDARPAAEVATEWLEANDFLAEPVDSIARGSVVVGSTNFYEQEILGELYAQELEHLGWQVDKKFQLGNREVVFPALRSGEIDILPEYLASALTVAYEGEATTDAAETAELLAEAAEADDLVVLDFAEATNANGFVVTQETADQYSLTNVSDLAKPAP
jgi:osmoprotectant transport system substrate-binding protein